MSATARSIAGTPLLRGHSADHAYPRAITSIEDLRNRFQQAVVSHGGTEVVRWRKEKGISAYAELPLIFYHYKPLAAVPHLGFNSEDAIEKALTGLFQAGGKWTAISLNSVHHEAKAVHGVEMVVCPDEFVFVLTYGFHTPERMRAEVDSEWRFTLARSKPDHVDPTLREPFLDTLRRALDSFAEILDPANSHLTTDLVDRKFMPKIAAAVA